MARLKAARYGGGRLITVATAAGALGLALSVVGFVVAPERAAHGWLVAFAYLVSLSLGALVFLMASHVIGARWPVAVRRLTEGVAGALPLLALGFLPVVLLASHLYLWVAPPAYLGEHTKHLLEHKEPYLNLPFFTLRGVIYFALWSVVVVLLRRWSFLSDGDTRSARERQRRARVFSAAMLPAVALTVTFASFDWLMSLEPTWFSTVFGIYYFAGGFVASLGLITALAHATRRAGLVKNAITPFHFHALARLLFAFTVFWAYIAFFQALLIRLADKPEEVVFYLERVEHGWQDVAFLLVLGRFVAPFFLLLPRAIKFQPAAMATVGGWIAIAHYIDIYWLVAPASAVHGVLPGWTDLSAIVGLTGAAVAYGAWRLRDRPLIPLGDPHLDEAIAYRSAS